MAKLFKKPEWIKTELDEVWYYIHIAILTLVLLVALKYVFGHDMLNISMFWKIGVAVIISDTIAHTILKKG